jgi:hypothetical protein
VSSTGWNAAPAFQPGGLACSWARVVERALGAEADEGGVAGGDVVAQRDELAGAHVPDRVAVEAAGAMDERGDRVAPMRDGWVGVGERGGCDRPVGSEGGELGSAGDHVRLAAEDLQRHRLPRPGEAREDAGGDGRELRDPRGAEVAQDRSRVLRPALHGAASGTRQGRHRLGEGERAVGGRQIAQARARPCSYGQHA